MSIRKGIQDIIVWRGLNFLSVLVLNILLARSLEASGAGNFFYLVNNLSLLVLILSFSMESGLTYFTANGRIHPKTAGGMALVFTLIATMLAFVVYYFARQRFGMQWFALLFVTGNLLISYFTALLYARQNFFLPNILLLVLNVLFILLFIPPLQRYISNDHLVIGYYGLFLLQGLAMTIVYLLSVNPMHAATRRWQEIKPLFRYAAAVFAGNLLFFFVYRVDYWFVEYYTSAHQLGNYIQVSKLVQWCVIIPSMIATVIFPLTATGKDATLPTKVTMLSRLLFTGFLIVCAIIALTGRFIYPWVFGETYDLMYGIFLLYIPGILALVALYPVSAWHSGSNRVNINIIGNLLALAVIISGNILFTPRYGMYAAAISSSIGYMVYFFFSLYHFKKVTNIRIRGFFSFTLADINQIKKEFPKDKKPAVVKNGHPLS
jgi:O-antigen/teichoic acid export membrane protein